MAGNGGIIGPTIQTSFGKNKVTTKTSSSPSAVTTQPGTRLIDTIIVAGGGGGGDDGGGGTPTGRDAPTAMTAGSLMSLSVRRRRSIAASRFAAELGLSVLVVLFWRNALSPTAGGPVPGGKNGRRGG